MYTEPTPAVKCPEGSPSPSPPPPPRTPTPKREGPTPSSEDHQRPIIATADYILTQAAAAAPSRSTSCPDLASATRLRARSRGGRFGYTSSLVRIRLFRFVSRLGVESAGLGRVGRSVVRSFVRSWGPYVRGGVGDVGCGHVGHGGVSVVTGNGSFRVDVAVGTAPTEGGPQPNRRGSRLERLQRNTLSPDPGPTPVTAHHVRRARLSIHA
ncbi:hypothetical protein H6P81_008510 [Aristolochia fimbriata]|uniref:Uncharacterized protein n=1 Tax=Aristolochia fimbriata TaxID=158543 RepID=A0AAV7EI67_ARIFI|nr:hypothetical protein H6P81_008510 [Aristolochia fimbriata]